MKDLYCQSCGMPLSNPSDMGTNRDKSLNPDFCSFCFQNGHFTEDCSMEEMIQHNLKHLEEFNSYSHTSFTKQEAIKQMREYFPTLKRWKKDITKKSHYQTINKVIDYINCHLYESMDIETLARKANVSTFHFQRIFKAIIGENIGSYIQRIRLEKIAHRLLNQSVSIAQLAEESNYESKNALSKAFKKHFGVAPSIYRQHPELYISTQRVSWHTIISLKPEIKIIQNFYMVYLSVNQAKKDNINYNDSWRTLKSFVEKNNLNETGNYLHLGFDDPLITEPDKNRSYIAHTLDQKIKPLGKFGVTEVEGGLFAVFRHKGAYMQLENIYTNIYLNWLNKSGYTLRDSYSFELYIRTPDEVETDDLVTDIYIPLEERLK